MSGARSQPRICEQLDLRPDVELASAESIATSDQVLSRGLGSRVQVQGIMGQGADAGITF